jgi:hypothetical protein
MRIDGNFLRRVVTGGVNAPWGLALAPDNFGPFSNALLVGNFGFGDGKINVYDPSTGQFLGNITDASGKPLAIEGLWAITFGNGGSGGDTNALYFAAGINRTGPNSFGAADGLFGVIRFLSSPPGHDVLPGPGMAPSGVPPLAGEGTSSVGSAMTEPVPGGGDLGGDTAPLLGNREIVTALLGTVWHGQPAAPASGASPTTGQQPSLEATSLDLLFSFLTEEDSGFGPSVPGRATLSGVTRGRQTVGPSVPDHVLDQLNLVWEDLVSERTQG